MEILWNIASFIVALGILVTIHEYGHFWVARKFGVKVLTFSVGFGKPLIQKIGKDGVRYVIAAIPLGGYVKMLDERENSSAISEDDKPFAFNRQSVWVRMAIVLAGPLANFLLAILLYWFMFLLGIKGFVPEIAEPPESSIAAVAGLTQGDRIVAVDGTPVSVMNQLTKNIARRMGEVGSIDLEVERTGIIPNATYSLDIGKWQVDADKPQLLHSLGLYHRIEKLGTVIGEVTLGGAADKAGMEVGDRVTRVNEQSVNSWQEMRSLVTTKPNQSVLVEVERAGELITLSVVIGSAKQNGKEYGVIGVANSLPNSERYVITREAGFFEAFSLAIDETVKMIALSGRLFVKLLSGEISTKSLSGPVSIAEGAGSSASIGLVYFISFLAMISVNLGFINLLPVPMLDGGHFLYYAVEAIRGKPLSQKVQEIGLQIGMMLVFALMALAIFNDISRF
jgi:regulator of sigma E protease